MSSPPLKRQRDSSGSDSDGSNGSSPQGQYSKVAPALEGKFGFTLILLVPPLVQDVLFFLTYDSIVDGTFQSFQKELLHAGWFVYSTVQEFVDGALAPSAHMRVIVPFLLAMFGSADTGFKGFHHCGIYKIQACAGNRLSIPESEVVPSLPQEERIAPNSRARIHSAGNARARALMRVCSQAIQHAVADNGHGNTVFAIPITARPVETRLVLTAEQIQHNLHYRMRYTAPTSLPINGCYDLKFRNAPPRFTELVCDGLVVYRPRQMLLQVNPSAASASAPSSVSPSPSSIAATAPVKSFLGRLDLHGSSSSSPAVMTPASSSSVPADPSSAAAYSNHAHSSASFTSASVGNTPRASVDPFPMHMDESLILDDLKRKNEEAIQSMQQNRAKHKMNTSAASASSSSSVSSNSRSLTPYLPSRALNDSADAGLCDDALLNSSSSAAAAAGIALPYSNANAAAAMNHSLFHPSLAAHYPYGLDSFATAASNEVVSRSLDVDDDDDDENTVSDSAPNKKMKTHF